jgi:transcriptional regulator with XRE-family HTH domain
LIIINPHGVNYFSSNLKYLIKKFATNQEQLAFHVNKKQTTISNWINEISVPDLRDLVKIYQYFGISIDALVLSDLSNGKVVTDEHVQEFKRNGKVIGKVLGKVRAVSSAYFVDEEGLTNVLNEPEDVLTGAIMGQMKIMDGKLDILRVMAEKLLEKGNK